MGRALLTEATSLLTPTFAHRCARNLIGDGQISSPTRLRFESMPISVNPWSISLDAAHSPAEADSAASASPAPGHLSSPRPADAQPPSRQSQTSAPPHPRPLQPRSYRTAASVASPSRLASSASPDWPHPPSQPQESSASQPAPG